MVQIWISIYVPNISNSLISRSVSYFSSDIIQAVQAYIGDGAKEIENLKLLKSLMPKDDIIIVGFFKTAEDEGVQAFKDLGNFINSDYNGCMFKDFLPFS